MHNSLYVFFLLGDKHLNIMEANTRNRPIREYNLWRSVYVGLFVHAEQLQSCNAM